MRIFLFLIGMLVGAAGFSQFNTSYNINGDPLSEIIDDSGMRQGKWIYYDFQEKKYKEENYKDNKLISQNHFVKGEIVNSIHYEQVKVEIPNKYLKVFENISGEYVFINSNDKEFSFYYEVDKSSEYSKEYLIEIIEELIFSKYSNFEGVIFIF